MTAPIVIRGVEYPDAETAAAALGIKPVTVKKAIRDGKTDRLGLKRGPEPGMVRVRGRIYKSAATAARALQVSPITIYVAIRRGREDFVGLNRSRKHSIQKPDKRPHPLSTPVQIGQKTWPSINAAARDLGVHDRALRRHLKADNRDWLAARLMDMIAKEAGQTGKVPPSIDKEAYSQMGRDRWEARKHKEAERQ